MSWAVSSDLQILKVRWVLQIQSLPDPHSALLLLGQMCVALLMKGAGASYGTFPSSKLEAWKSRTWMKCYVISVLYFALCWIK